MNKKRLLLLALYLIYLISVRILINIVFRDWLITNIPKDFVGSIIWGLIKTLHWCLPILIYLAFVDKKMFSYLSEKYNLHFNWFKVILLLTVWGALTFIINGFRVPEQTTYGIIHDVLITGIVEEFVFRGFVLDKLNELIGFKKANLLQSIFFSVNHLPWLYMLGLFSNPFQIVFLLSFYVFFGLVTGYLTKRTKSLIPATLLHIVNNIFAN